MVKTVFSDEEKRSASSVLVDNRAQLSHAGNPILRFSRPFFARYIVPVVENMKIDNKRKDFKRKIASAGLTDIFTPDELFSFKLFLIIGFPVLLSFIKIAWAVDVPLWLFPTSMMIGYAYPDLIWLPGVIKARQEEIFRNMPFVVDLLALSTEAGLDFMGAIGKVVEKSKPSALVSEMETILKEIKIGSSRREALRNMAWRINMSEINSFIAVLISADEMGASIGKILRQQSEQIRHERFIRAEKAGSRAARQILFPMILFIIPAIFIMIFAPFGIDYYVGNK